MFSRLPGWAFFVGQGWKIQNIAQLDRCRQDASFTDRATGVQLGGFSPRAYVLSLPCTHAYTHAPRLTPIAGRIVRRYKQARANFTSNTAHCCYSPQRRYHGPEHRERRREHSTIFRGSGRDVTALAPRLGGEPGCGSDVSGPVSSTRYSAICRPGGLCSHANGYCAPLRTAAGPKFP